MKKFLALTFSVLILLACNEGHKKTEDVQDQNKGKTIISKSEKETEEMVTNLRQLLPNSNVEHNIFLNEERVIFFENKLKMEPPYGIVWFEYCTELLRSGKTEACINQLEGYFDPAFPIEQQIRSNDDVLAIELLALAYLRLGEQENCQENHTEFSCILPLQKPGVHSLVKGSKRAIELYEKMYDNVPKKEYKWLINLAYMTLGQHPGAVPEKYLIPFPNWNYEQADFPRFKEVAMQVNLAQNGLSGGTCLDDFNQDGFIDVFVTGFGINEQCHLFLNDGNGSFKDGTESAGLLGIVGGLNCIHADYNNDGFRDIFVLRGAWFRTEGNHPNSLLKNNGDGTFSDVTKSAGLLTFHPTQTASWADFNKDGFLDLFIGNETTPEASHTSELFQNNGDGTFTEVAAKVGLDDINAFIKGAVWGDINNDGWPDLFLSQYNGENYLFKNTNGKFSEITEKAGVKGPVGSFPCWFWDVNNDGYQDLFVSGYDMAYRNVLVDQYVQDLEGGNSTLSHPAIYINNGDETFANQTKAYNLSQAMYPMGCNFGDLDNDGYLDFYLATGCPDFTAVVPNRMFRNVDGKRFEEVTSAGGFGHVQKGHGVGFADLDNDGDQEIYAVMGGAYSADKFTNILFENPGFDNNWIVIELEGVTTNKDGLGSRIELELNNGRKLYRIVSTGGSFGASSIQQEIGLGKSDRIKTLSIYWQNGDLQVFKDLAVNQKIHILEGTAKFETKSYQHVPFKANASGGHHHH